ncbi:uncharacterized protein KY384_004789 [Bacidia gigantensis]|uniref:uncharacterized protein n=1 Tax=Bacidia gigantensis TaxID=2732470 RepID=UPI001D040B12|nr:uncharacterized protein KY384_004789 [Bacidia gigantensis]KAG8530287.1 hypothetical protein KY384_004789 [Bacidia gigantensis]
MAEALAVIGLVANITQFIDLGTKIARRMDEMRLNNDEAPRVFRTIRGQVPLLVDTLQRLKERSEKGDLSLETEKALMPVIDGCLSELDSVDKLIEKIVPVAGDSSWRRNFKALSSVATEKKVQNIISSLRDYIQNLTLYQTVQTANSQMASFRENTKSDPIFMVPFERDSKYVDRSDITAQLDAKLRSNRRAGLAGLGGVGYRERDPEAHIFWIHASEAARVDQSYKHIAKKLNLPGWDDLSLNTFELVSEWLNTHGRWLLVLDNADDLDLFFGPPAFSDQHKQMHQYLPRCEESSTIITSRDTKVAYRLSDREDPIVVENMTVEDAETLLRSRLSQDNLHPRYANDLRQLLDILDRMPLAVTQAAAFVTENNIEVSEYIDILRVNQAEVEDLLCEDLGDHRRYSEAPSSVLETLKPSFDQIVKQKPLAAELLSFIAFLDRNSIPKSLLKREGVRTLDFVSALGTLQNFSLISTRRGGKSIDVHRLVQISIQRWLRGERETWQNETVRALSERLPVGSYENWDECEVLSPHAQTVLSYSIEGEEAALRRAKILHNLATLDEQQSRYGSAEKRLREAVNVRKAVLGIANSDTIRSMSSLGEVLFREAQYTEAASVLGIAIEESSKLFGPEAEETLYNVALKAEVVQGLGDFSDSEELFRRSLQGEGKSLKDADAMRIADNFGAVLRDQKKYEESEYWIKKGLLGRERIFGETHPSTLRSVNHYALILQLLGRLDESETMAQRAISGSEILMGRDHHQTLMSVHTYGDLLRVMGRYEEAKEQFRRALEGFTKVLGPQNRATMRILHSLGLIEEIQGNLINAESLLRQAAEGETTILGPTHAFTVESMHDLKRVSTMIQLQQHNLTSPSPAS